MSDPIDHSAHDLFDFPEVDGLEEFGLVPPVPASMLDADGRAPSPAAVRNAPAPAANAAGATLAAVPAAALPARANPPIPEGIDNLDEDLFSFDELFSLDDDPYRNGTLGVDGLPANNLFVNPTASKPEPAPAPVQQEAAPAPAPAPQPKPAPQAQPQSQPQAQPQATAAPQPHYQAQAGPLPSAFSPSMPEGEYAAGNAPGHAPRALRDRGPRILLPEDVPYASSPENGRMFWVLVACVLYITTGTLYVTYRSGAVFQSSLQTTTDKLANAISQGKSAPAPSQVPSQSPELAATSASMGVDPALTYSVAAPAPRQAVSDLPRRSQRDRWIDPRDYTNTHEFAVGNAKALLAEGRFEDARHLLNHVLANQGRIPLSPVLREEIDYLIPLTYFEQGNATAPSEGEKP